MEKVKQRIKLLKDSIEDAELREADARSAIKQLEDRIDILGGEKTTLLSRINVVEAERDKITERLKMNEEKLVVAERRNEESELRRKELVDIEVDDFERSEEMENRLKEAALAKRDADHRVVEAERRMVILEGEYVRMVKKYETFTEKEEELKRQIKEYIEETNDLEEKDRDASEREDVNEEKMKFLDEQLHETLTSVETFERDAGKLESFRDQLLAEIQSWNDKRDAIRAENDEMEQLLLEDD